MSTLKSPLLRAFFTPHVHPRPRKRPPRYTLDCGFTTSESPALRGFVGGRWSQATTFLYLVLKSNGYNHPEIRLKKFEFSLKTTSTNLVKSHPHTHSSNQFSSTFSTSLTNGPRSRSLTKVGTHSTLPEKSHTAAYTPKHGASLLCSRTGHLTVLHQAKEKPEESDARLWRVSDSSGAAPPLGYAILFAIWRCCGFYALRTENFCTHEVRCGITTLSVCCMLPKCRTAACQNGSFVVFRS